MAPTAAGGPTFTDKLRAEMAEAEAERLEAEAQIAQIRADEAKDAAERARKQGTATAPGR